MIDEKELRKEEREWDRDKKLLKRKNKIEKEKQKYTSKRKELTTTKMLILFLFINCTLIELFTGWATVQSLNLSLQTGVAPDFTPLVTLIGTVVGEVISFGVYAAKSIKENTVNGITYELAMRENKDDTNGTVG